MILGRLALVGGVVRVFWSEYGNSIRKFGARVVQWAAHGLDVTRRGRVGHVGHGICG